MATNDDNKRNRDKHLFYLNELSDYKVSSDDPDVRGWEVKDVDQRVIGKVDNLLVNKHTERVVYLDVEVHHSIIEAAHEPYQSSTGEEIHEFLNKDGEDHLIIPIGLVKLNNDDKFVFTDKINHKTFAETKRVKKGFIVTRDYEKAVLASYDRDNNSGNREQTSKHRNTTSAVSNKEPNAYKRDHLSDSDKQQELTKDAATETHGSQGSDLKKTNVSHSGSISESGRNKISDHPDSTETKRKSIPGENSDDTELGNSHSKKDTTSGRDSEKNDEKDFYNKKEFDDNNDRKRR
ncbi:hypothetical protein DET49_12229 [Salegentibacter sp. 24]|uniref:hypothetical protein n=1 Tax=Salegentibacter sp. 24 TaxID=2183986 RepID=UPI00105C4CE2|nr:hypothetical protein [Salegentibacter sp. 24]TDN83059.1 hypothetical protein DET49_12229 [Salegentibacter sp. 24]